MEYSQPIQLPLLGSPVLSFAPGSYTKTSFEDGLDVSADCDDNFVGLLGKNYSESYNSFQKFTAVYLAARNLYIRD